MEFKRRWLTDIPTLVERGLKRGANDRYNQHLKEMAPFSPRVHKPAE